MWTHFWDMSSGGGKKEKFKHCWIEAPESEAVSIFYARFGHNPHRVTCTCCGSDYSVSECESLEEGTEYCREDFIKQNDVLIIRADEIKDDERREDVPEQGYVWKD